MAVPPRVRFAPSPTGQVHIGNIRTAIFNWLFARHEQGQFLLRIEDTDRERSTQEAITALLAVMEWLGLDYDGEPLYQSAQAEAHRAAAERLLAAGHAYRHAKGESGEAIVFRLPCQLAGLPFVRPAEMVSMEIRADQPLTLDYTGLTYFVSSKKGEPVEQTCSLAGMPELVITDAAGQVLCRLADALPELLAGRQRLALSGAARLTFRRHVVFYQDLIKGELAKPLDSLRDFVIVRSDGAPVFHLANVCDDIAQGITHIVRGDDHVENTYRHLFLFHALGATIPSYGHLPMIVNAQGKPYSKRDGDAYVGDFRAKGYLAEALFNYLTLLGWSPGDDREKLTRAELVSAFTLERVKSSPAQMDLVKLENLNGQYLAELPLATFAELAWAQVAGAPWAQGLARTEFDRVAALMQSRTKLLGRVGEWYYFFTDQLEFDEKAVRKHLLRDGMPEALRTVARHLADTPAPCDLAAIESAILTATNQLGSGAGKLNLPLRIAITGSQIGAGLYEIIELLGQARTVARLNATADGLQVPAANN